MKVILASRGNPDMGQDSDKPYMYCEPDKEVEVESFAEASKACRKFIRDNELGYGNWSGGSVFLNGKHVAYVSYNGRVWDLGGVEIPLETTK